MNAISHPSGDSPDVVVIGGGIGGLATAIAARQSGRSALVLERSPGPSEVDTGITLWSFAVRVLRELGVDEPDRFGAPLERIISYSAGGEKLSEVDLRPAAGEVGAASFDVHRAELLGALTSVLGTGVVRFGSKCVGVRDDGGFAAARLEDGSEVRGRILVGADGVRSIARAHVAPRTRIRTAALGAWRGVDELDEALVPTGAHLRIYGPAGVFGAARLDSRRVRWYAGARVSSEAKGTWDELRHRFGGWCEPAASILATGPPTGLLYNDAPRFRPLASWARGRVALVGDAAHTALPTLGVSGGLALADGLALGTALVRAPDAGALQAYARRRSKIGRRVQREAELFRLLLAPRRRRLVRARDRLLSPSVGWFQGRGTTHLTHGAEAPVAAEVLPRALRPANRRSAPADLGWSPAEESDPAARACLVALRRAAGVDLGPIELHSRRIERIALELAAMENRDLDALVLRCAALLHDIGLYHPWFRGGPYTEASEAAARTVLGAAGIEPERVSRCADAVRWHHSVADQSLHGPEVELLRRADWVDVTGGRVSFGLPRRTLEELFDELPRTGFGRHVAWMLLRRSVERPRSARAFVLENVFRPGRGQTSFSVRRGTS